MKNNQDKINKMLEHLESEADKKFLPIVGPEKGKIIIEIINKINPKYILEIGTLFGYSAILICKELGEDARLITIEFDPEAAEIAKENMEKAGITANVEIVIGDALKILPGLKYKFDLVFLDATKKENIEYLKLLENKLHEGSVLIADDAGVMPEQMEDYLNYVRFSGKYESKYVPVGDNGLEVSTKL